LLAALVGRRIVIKAQNGSKWYLAEVTDFNERRTAHEIEYDDGQGASCKVVQAHLLDRQWTFEGDIEEDENQLEQDRLLSASSDARVDELLGDSAAEPNTPTTKPTIAFEVGGVKFQGQVK
jgi:hypothetical protein